MENFYNAMTTYINSKKPKCQHERTLYYRGWEVCAKCCINVHRTLFQDLYSNVAGYAFAAPKEDRSAKIRKTMTDAINSVTLKKINLDGMSGWDGPLEDGLPLELLDHWNELCLKCMDMNVKCHVRSLCAAVLWKKVKSLYPDVMTLTEFSKKVGVSVLTIIKILKKI